MSQPSAPATAGGHPLGGGRWWIPVPIPSRILRATSVYALEVERGVVLIDAGWDAPASLEALAQGLASLGATLDDVVGVLVTHAHADHLGLAPRLRERSGAWVGLHALDAALLLDVERVARALQRASRWMARQGVPSDARSRLADEWRRVLNQYRVAPPDLRLEAGPLALPGTRKLRIIHTPGHTPGHICVAEERDGVLFTGDHVLPGISPNVSAHPRSSPDPVEDHLHSLRKLSARQVLPGHGQPFGDLALRVERLVAGHERRADEVLTAVAQGASSTWQVATTIRWSRPWADLGAAHQRLALGEVEAHLCRWRRKQRMVVSVGRDAVQRWSVAGPPHESTTTASPTG